MTTISEAAAESPDFRTAAEPGRPADFPADPPPVSRAAVPTGRQRAAAGSGPNGSAASEAASAADAEAASGTVPSNGRAAEAGQAAVADAGSAPLAKAPAADVPAAKTASGDARTAAARPASRAPAPSAGALKRATKAMWGFFLSFAIIFALIALWEILPRFGLIDPFLLPPFSSVVRKTFMIMRSGEFFKHFNISMIRILAGFFGALSLAIPAGILMGWFRTLEEYLNPLVETCRNSSVLALYPIFILLFGVGELAKISIIVWGTTWVVLLNTISGVKNVDPALIKSARSMGVGDLSLLRRVLLPASLPSIITGVRLGATNAILVMIAAEMIGSNAGLGFMIFYFEARYAIPEMYGGIIFLAVMGLVVNDLLRRAEKRLTGWQEKSVYLGI